MMTFYNQNYLIKLKKFETDTKTILFLCGNEGKAIFLQKRQIGYAWNDIHSLCLKVIIFAKIASIFLFLWHRSYSYSWIKYLNLLFVNNVSREYNEIQTLIFTIFMTYQIIYKYTLNLVQNAKMQEFVNSHNLRHEISNHL